VVLVDTSVWISHLRNGLLPLKKLLLDGIVLCHPFIIGEIACGHLSNRLEILTLLGVLPQSKMAEHGEVFRFLHDRRLMGKGLGWVDMHLLASALLTRASLWTQDKALAFAAKELRLSFHPS